MKATVLLGCSTVLLFITSTVAFAIQETPDGRIVMTRQEYEDMRRSLRWAQEAELTQSDQVLWLERDLQKAKEETADCNASLMEQLSKATNTKKKAKK